MYLNKVRVKNVLKRQFRAKPSGGSNRIRAKMLPYLILFLSMLVGIKTEAQSDLNAMLEVAPPYPAYLGDYANPSLDKMALTLTATNPEIGTWQLRLKMILEKGNSIIAYSNDVVVGEPSISLALNIPRRITGAELAPYFRLDNLQGISPDGYNRLLTEGLYRVTFEMYDKYNNNKVGSVSQQMWIVLNDPPQLNMPQNAENIQTTTAAQSLNFQWIPRAIQGAGLTDYEFTLVELLDDFGDTYQQFLSSSPKFQTTVQTTTLAYGAGQPILQSGRTYAWRVRAKARQGITNVALFKNDGYSDIFTFKYLGSCTAPSGLQVQAKAYDQISVNWSPSAVHSSYRVAYRKYSTTLNWQWVEQTTSNTFLNLTGLEPSTQYEVKVGGICGPNLISFTAPMTVTTLGAGQVNGIVCGQQPAINIANQALQPSLYINDVIQAGDFPVTLTYVTGSNGTFSGSGWIKVPWMADTRFRVQFAGITVNTDKKLIAGVIETMYDPASSNIADIDSTVVDIIRELNELENVLKDLLAKLSAGMSRLTPDEIKKASDAIDRITSSKGGYQSVSSPDFLTKLNELKELIKTGNIPNSGVIQSNLSNTQEAKDNQSKKNASSECYNWASTTTWIKTNKGQIVNYDYKNFITNCGIKEEDRSFDFVKRIKVVSPEGIEREITIDGEYNRKVGQVQIDLPCIRIPMEIGNNRIYFNFDIYYTGTTDFSEGNRAIRISVTKFEDYRDLLALFGYQFSDNARTWYITRFQEFLNKTEVKSDGNKLDFVYEEMPLFVAKGIGDARLYSDLEILANSRIDRIWTNEHKSIANLVAGYTDSGWWINKMNSNIDFFINILGKLNGIEELRVANTFSDICATGWLSQPDNDVIVLTPSEIKFKEDVETGISEDHTIWTLGSEVTHLNPSFRFSNKVYLFKLGVVVPVKESPPISTIEKNPLEGVKVIINDEYNYFPAFIAYSFIHKGAIQERWDLITEHINLLLPEASGVRFRFLSEIKSKKTWTWEETALSRSSTISSEQALSVTIDEFVEISKSTMQQYSVPGQKGYRLILGKDDAVTIGKKWPTMDGILDIHIHGDGNDLFGAFEKSRTSKKFWSAYTPEHIAAMINTHYPDVKGVRIYSCWGVESGSQRVANLTRKPVLTSMGGPIKVNLRNGKMYMEQGEMIILLPH